MKRVMIKNKIDKMFFCPYCKSDLRKEGIDYQEDTTEYATGNNRVYYNEDGTDREIDYGDKDYGDTDTNELRDFCCGNCGEELNVGSSVINNLNVSNLWEE